MWPALSQPESLLAPAIQSRLAAEDSAFTAQLVQVLLLKVRHKIFYSDSSKHDHAEQLHVLLPQLPVILCKPADGLQVFPGLGRLSVLLMPGSSKHVPHICHNSSMLKAYPPREKLSYQTAGAADEPSLLACAL